MNSEKLWCMFSGKKTPKELMKSEFSSIFWVRLTANNDVWVSVDSFYVYLGYSNIHLNETCSKWSMYSMSREYIYELFVFKQQIPKFSQHTLFNFITNLWKFENWWCITLPYSIILPILWKLMVCYCKLFLNNSWINFQSIFKDFSKNFQSI